MEMPKEVSQVNDRKHFIDALQYHLFCWLEREVTSRVGWHSFESGQVAIASDVGAHRGENQDQVVVLRSGSADSSETVLVVVCDGMGGMQDGRTCASLSASGMIASFLRSHSLDSPERLENAARDANKSVFSKYFGKGGATLSAICYSNSGTVFGVNVGDSRIYGIKSGELSALSVDDTIAGQIGHQGGGLEATSLLQYIGIGSEIEPHLIKIPEGTNRLVLTTDGAHFIPREALLLLAANGRTPIEVARRLVQAAQWMGSRDNGTVACLELPLRLKASPFERSITLYDPWGEMHFVNYAEHQPTTASHYSVATDKPLAVQPNQPLREQSARYRPKQHKKRKNDRKGQAGSLALNRPERKAPTVEITELIDTPPSDGDR